MQTQYDNIKDLVSFFNQNKKLTHRQQTAFTTFIVRDYNDKEGGREDSDEGRNGTEPKGDREERKEEFRPLSAIDTAEFLKLFNNPFGLKYLTHDFDPIEDGRPHNLDELHAQAKKILETNDYKIPSSLLATIYMFLDGKGMWIDTFGKKHDSFIINKEWINWSDKNKKHPINNPDYSKEIMAFRATTRLVAPALKTICEEAMKGLLIHLTENKIQNADFLTNTFILYRVIKRIFDMMNRRAKDCPEVEISYKRSVDTQGRMQRQIVITQIHSFADKTLDDVRERLNSDPEAGDFGAIRKLLNGYCLWQVETKWNGGPFRWNILKTDEMPDKENLNGDDIKGFTHILTFYIL